MPLLLPILFGLIVGLSLGLTGGGGSILAVPLLIFGLGMNTHDATSASLAAVGFTALFGAIQRWVQKSLNVLIAAIFSLGGLVGVPLGKTASLAVNEALFLFLFAGLMIFVSVRMWTRTPTAGPPSSREMKITRPGASVNPRLERAALAKLVIAGVGAGFLAGFFGIGGGFIIVPALVLFARTPIHTAVGTSLAVIAVLGIAGFLHGLWLGESFPLQITAWFVLGGVLGMLVGSAISSRLSAQKLQKLFAIVIIAVALFMIASTALKMRSSHVRGPVLPAVPADNPSSQKSSPVEEKSSTGAALHIM